MTTAYGVGPGLRYFEKRNERIGILNEWQTTCSTKMKNMKMKSVRKVQVSKRLVRVAYMKEKDHGTRPA